MKCVYQNCEDEPVFNYVSFRSTNGAPYCAKHAALFYKDDFLHDREGVLYDIHGLTHEGETEMDTKKYVTAESLRAEDLGEGYTGDFVVDKEEPVVEQKYDDAVKLVVKGQLDGEDARLVLNKTNLRRIQELYGTESDGWKGKKIPIYTDYVTFNNDDVLAIRVRKGK